MQETEDFDWLIETIYVIISRGIIKIISVLHMNLAKLQIARSEC